MSSTRTKERIPRALREQVWLRTAGAKHFEIKCPVPWCQNRITAFDFHVGHNVPEAAGGTVDIGNLIAICARCNLSMGSHFTIEQWCLIVRSSSPVGSTTEVQVPTSGGGCCWWPWRTKKASVQPLEYPGPAKGA